MIHFLNSGLIGFPMAVQVFLDVVESVNILVNSNGQIIRSDVVGALKMRTYLRLVLTSLQSSRILVEGSSLLNFHADCIITC